MIAETESLVVLETLGLVKKEKVKKSLYIYKDFAEILERNGICLTVAINIGLEMFLRSRGLIPEDFTKKILQK